MKNCSFVKITDNCRGLCLLSVDKIEKVRNHNKKVLTKQWEAQCDKYNNMSALKRFFSNLIYNKPATKPYLNFRVADRYGYVYDDGWKNFCEHHHDYALNLFEQIIQCYDNNLTEIYLSFSDYKTFNYWSNLDLNKELVKDKLF